MPMLQGAASAAVFVMSGIYIMGSDRSNGGKCSIDSRLGFPAVLNLYPTHILLQVSLIARANPINAKTPKFHS